MPPDDASASRGLTPTDNYQLSTKTSGKTVLQRTWYDASRAYYQPEWIDVPDHCETPAPQPLLACVWCGVAALGDPGAVLKSSPETGYRRICADCIAEITEIVGCHAAADGA